MSLQELRPRITPSVIDKSKGRVQILEGRMFYSPNCGRTVDPPPPPPCGGNPFIPPQDCLSSTPVHERKRRNFWKIDVSVFEQPRWWDPSFGWIAFYDKTALISSSTLINILCYSRSQFIFEEEVGYMLSRSERDDWLRLDNQLNQVYVALVSACRISGISPCNPWIFGYLRPHKSRGILSLCLEKSRQWFGVWMALLSYCIAVTKTLHFLNQDYPLLARPPWNDIVLDASAEKGIDHVWMEMFLDSPIPSFSNKVSRAGTFVHLSHPDNGMEPSIEWFMEYGVPVWYEWPPKDAARHLRFAPLEHQIQDALSFRTKSPVPSSPTNTIQSFNLEDTHPQADGSPLTSCDNSRAPSPTLPQNDLPILTTYMDEFFRLRDARIQRILQHETPQQRSTRLSRQAQPPIKKARAFEWRQSGSGEFTHEEILTKNQREYCYDYYSNSQSRYDPVLNEWHYCELWGEYEPGDLGFATYEGDDRSTNEAVAPPIPDLPITETPVEDFLVPDPARSLEIADGPSNAQDIRLLRLQEEILTIASLYFGYTAQIPLPVCNPLRDEKQRKSFCRSFGLIWSEVEPIQDVFEDPQIAAAIDFFRRLAKNSNILTNEWDLCSNNLCMVSSLPRFRQFRPLQTNTKETIYMLDLGPNSKAPWKLAVKCALDALMVCRLEASFTEYDIVEFLLTNGIPFHTLQPSDTVSRTPNTEYSSSLSSPHRPSDYTFGSRDYLAYRERCHTILSHPRGRAALMHGHFMWRLALRSVRWEAVYKGPSSWSPHPDEMLVVQDSITKQEYIDDKLSLEEQEALCGTYRCFTGQGAQISIKSWYMPPHIYEKSNQTPGRWCSHTESLFNLLDRVYTEKKTLTRGPKPRHAWDNEAHSSLDIRKARMRLERIAKGLFGL